MRAPFAMLRPEAYPHAVRGLELVETHISWVVLTGDFAYKIKKPVRFDFIDASTLERRRLLCEEELRLNRRLAPDLYLAMVPIGGTPRAPRVGAAEGVFEYAVQMRQFDRAQELAALLDQGEVSRAEVERLAARIAAFHAHVSRAGAEDGYGSFEQVRVTLMDNLRALASQPLDASAAQVLRHLADWTRERLVRDAALIERRKGAGAVRECHGDLHARNIVRWNGELVPFDCLEFDPWLRWNDVASELAFLHMDLLAHTRPDLASVLLSEYLGATGDYEALRVVQLYHVHCALVRAKVDGLAGNRVRAAMRIGLARQLSQPGEPAIILMRGVTGSGKSWLSSELVPALGALRVRSDLERKRLAGLAAGEHAAAAPGQGLYVPQSTERTYSRLLDCAEHALSGGFSIIVDAAFPEAEKRAAFRELAGRFKARFLLVSCTADADVLSSRVRVREAAGRDPSDATLAVLEQQLAGSRPIEASECDSAVTIDTSVPGATASAIELIRSRLSRSP